MKHKTCLIAHVDIYDNRIKICFTAPFNKQYITEIIIYEGNNILEIMNLVNQRNGMESYISDTYINDYRKGVLYPQTQG